MKQILSYFPDLTEQQIRQLSLLENLYKEWNDKINVISRKDINELYEHHVLHSLAIAKYISFKDGSRILDVGTGGGFPGIPLAIMYPNCHFKLIDSIRKKTLVATEISKEIGLNNTTIIQENAKDEKQKYDFVVSRAVMNTQDLVKLIKKNVSPKGNNSIPNGLICLKGGDLSQELEPIKRWYELTNISEYFKLSFFETKKILYIPLQ